jgi:hypothetical protein
MKQLLAYLLCAVVASTCTAQTISVKPCTIGKDAPAFGFWTWPANSTIKVYILKADFGDDETAYLLKPIRNWSTATVSTGPGITLEYAGTTTQPLYCQNCLTIMRGPVFNKLKRHATELQTYSAQSNQIMTWAHIVVDPVLTNREALTNAVAHELGHSFGLIDCYSCKSKSTVMNQFKTVNEPNEMQGPTACDVAEVSAAYRELAIRVRPAPIVQVVDEGEEPLDDDTPIVVRKP